MSKRKYTRMQRVQRNARFACLLGLAIGVVLLIVVAVHAVQQPDPVVEPETVVVAPVAMEEPTTEETPAEPSPEEEFTPIRDDIPLDDETQLLLYQASCVAGVQYELALAVVWKETNFRNVVGDSGASIGYMQVQPRWHSERMEHLGVTDLADAYGNFLVGCDYLAELLEKDRGVEWALMAYNGGPSYANKMAKAEKVSQYAQKVLNYMNDLGGN